MIAAISPEEKHTGESLSTLQFASSVRGEKKKKNLEMSRTGIHFKSHVSRFKV